MVEPAKRRIQTHRERDPKPGEKQLLDDVENYGCHVIYVREDQHLPGWSYTIGLNETFRQPEILAVGLKIDTAHYLLNEIAERLNSGLPIEEGLRQNELLANVQCEFRKVEDRAELGCVLGYASWFYGDDLFPVFQCVYPDLDDATIEELIDLPRGWCASRDLPSDPWTREPKSSDKSSS